MRCLQDGVTFIFTIDASTVSSRSVRFGMFAVDVVLVYSSRFGIFVGAACIRGCDVYRMVLLLYSP